MPDIGVPTSGPLLPAPSDSSGSGGCENEQPDPDIRGSLAPNMAKALLTAAAEDAMGETVSLVLSQYSAGPVSEAIVRAAVNAGSTKMMQLLLATDPSVINMQLDMRGTPLIVACQGRQETSFLRFLLEAGADPNQGPDAAAYPLALVAGLYTDTSVIDLLLQHGARLQHSGALSAAARLGNEAMLRHLLHKGATSATDLVSAATHASPLDTATGAGRWGIVAILMRHEAYSNTSNDRAERAEIAR